MEKILTAEEYQPIFLARKDLSNWDKMSTLVFAREYAKLHVKAALESVFDKIDLRKILDTREITKDSILNTYPLTNIK